MALQAPAYITVDPSFSEPEILLQYSQPSGFIELLSEGEIRARLGEDDLAVYMRQLNLRTKIAVGQSSYNELPGVDLVASYFSTATYLTRVRSNWDHHDVSAGGRWNIAVPDGYQLGSRQAHYQLARDACIHGMNPQNGEGIINANGALAVTLPPDQWGHTTAQSYDNGEFAFFLMQEVAGIKTRTLQLGIGKEFTLIGPQRVLGLFEYNVVQLTQYQRQGAGTDSTAGVFKEVLLKNGDKLTWTYDDTLIGAGAGGTDALILTMPELTKPAARKPSTNEFAKLLSGNKTCNAQYSDMAAPREIISPLAGGATDYLTEWRISSGWPVRPQATTIISVPYS